MLEIVVYSEALLLRVSQNYFIPFTTSGNILKSYWEVRRMSLLGRKFQLRTQIKCDVAPDLEFDRRSISKVFDAGVPNKIERKCTWRKAL